MHGHRTTCILTCNYVFLWQGKIYCFVLLEVHPSIHLSVRISLGMPLLSVTVRSWIIIMLSMDSWGTAVMHVNFVLTLTFVELSGRLQKLLAKYVQGVWLYSFFLRNCQELKSDNSINGFLKEKNVMILHSWSALLFGVTQQSHKCSTNRVVILALQWLRAHRS